MSFVEKSKRRVVELRRTEAGYRLFRNGKPFVIRGAGGFDHLERLVDAGGNSIRTWGHDQTEAILPEARRLDIAICAGLWLEPPRRGFDYSDEIATERQLNELFRQVDALKGEKQLLLWGVGNELELERADDEVWKAVERLAAYIKSADGGDHPVMTVIASPDRRVLRIIEAFCPSIDIVGINSYGDLAKVRPELRALGWRKPYLVTEWGSDGRWEVGQTAWGAEIEPTSTEKAQQIRDRYRMANEEDGLCLGSYFFLWGYKQETTATWFSLFDEKGHQVETVEALAALWTGQPEGSNAPRVSELLLKGMPGREDVIVKVGETLEASFDLIRGLPDECATRWVLSRESGDKQEGGDPESLPERLPIRGAEEAVNRLRFEAPKEPGAYRLFAYVYGPKNTLATTNIPFLAR